MEEAILQFNNQLAFEPEIKNQKKLGTYDYYVLCGMGGSHLAAGILKMCQPDIELYVHRNYDLPPYDEAFFKKSLLIASSYSGNTEEVISFLEKGIDAEYDVAVLSTGGKLIKIAKENKLPYVEIPDTHIQPRSALGYSLIGLAALINKKECSDELKELGRTFNPASFRSAGESLAHTLKNKIPIIYSSTENLSIAYNWKIKMNETGKVPAFYNLFSELNHNEMQGFGEGMLSDRFHFIMLRDHEDHPKIQKRMEITEQLLEKRGYGVTTLMLVGNTVLEKVFSLLIMADWTAVTLAKEQGVEPEKVAMIEEFKEMLTQEHPDHFSDDCVWC